MISHQWLPLQDLSGKRCIIWDYDKDDNRCVIYRFVWEAPDLPQVVFHVGSGTNLSSKNGRKTELTKQYKNGNRKNNYRLPMEKELQQKGGKFWTEVLELNDPALKQKIDAECKRDTKKTTIKMIRDYFIYQSYQDHCAKYQMYGKRLFGFHNKKIKKPPIFADKAE